MHHPTMAPQAETCSNTIVAPQIHITCSAHELLEAVVIRCMIEGIYIQISLCTSLVSSWFQVILHVFNV